MGPLELARSSNATQGCCTACGAAISSRGYQDTTPCAAQEDWPKTVALFRELSLQAVLLGST